MARRKKEEEIEKIAETEKVIYFRANRKLSLAEHQSLSEKIRFENEKTGLKIVLVPASCEVSDE